MNPKLRMWFDPGILDSVWFFFFGHFFGWTKEETRAWFLNKRSNNVDDFNELLYKDGDEFK